MSNLKYYNNVSIICSCKNRAEALRVTLPSWLNYDEVKEVIIVDWSSDKSIDYMLECDKRVKIISVPGKKYFNQPQPLNLALSFATGDYILKLDTDYILNPYFNFFEYYQQLDDTNYVCGRYKDAISEETYSEKHYLYEWDHDTNFKYVKSYLPVYKYLFGLLFITKKNLISVGGYNEKLNKYYAYEDDEICDRLELFGLQQIKIDYDNSLLHLPHSDRKRVENFEGIGEENETKMKHNLSAYYSDSELEWQFDYALAGIHIDLNKQQHGKVDNYFAEPTVSWSTKEIIKNRYFEAKMVKSKLENFPVVNYISLHESEDRRKNLHHQFETFGITKFAPFLSKRYEEGDHILFGSQLHHLDGGSKGCVVSHIEMIKEWYYNTDEYYGFFCEDDLSLETIKYWSFSWDDFIERLPDDAECVQLCSIRPSYDNITLRNRDAYDWCVTAYIMTRDYAKKVIERYIKNGGYDLEIDGGFYPMPENVLFNNNLGQVYEIDLFTESQELQSTFTESANLETGLKKYHQESHDFVINWWKTAGNELNIDYLMNISSDNISEELPKDKKKKEMILDIEDLIEQYSLDTENPELNWLIGNWYELQNHNAPALSFFLRCAERSEDDLLAYEALLHAANAYDRQGTRDLTTKGILQQAMTLMPRRPEAYYLLSLFTEKRSQWQECYFYADTALNFADFDQPELRTEVGYFGEAGLLFQKAISGWWWGKVEESGTILLDLRDNYDLPEHIKNCVENNLKQFSLNSEDPRYLTEEYVRIFEKIGVAKKEEDKHETEKIDLGKIDLILAGHYDESTNEIIDEYLKLPFVNDIIVSTWEGQGMNGYDSDRVKILRNEKPSPGTDNRNYQIVASQSGLNEVTTKYSARMRTDQKYTYDSMITMYEYMSENKEMDGSIFVAGVYPNLQFHPRDHVFWGLTEDLVKLFDVPLELNGFSDKMNIPKSELWKYYDYFERTETYIGSRYCMRFCRDVIKYIMEPENYLYDKSPKWEEAHNMSKELTPKVFKPFPKSGVDLEWSRKGLKNYPYDEQKNGYGECWAEDMA